jgi:hypothetical protein
MSRSRREVVTGRLQVERLEGRVVLAAGAVGGPLIFQVANKGVYSQQAPTADVSLTMRPLPGQARRPVAVEVATVDGPHGGTAKAGTHYLPVRQVVTFQPGERTKTISIPLVPDARNPGALTVAVQATAQTPRAETAATEITLDHRDDLAPPALARWRLVVEKGKARGIALTFSEDMNPATVQRRSNYVLWDSSRKPSVGDWIETILKAGGGGAFDPAQRRIKSVTYDPATRTALLVPRGRLSPTGQYDLTSGRRAPRPGLARPGGLADASGNLLGYFRIRVGQTNKALQAGQEAVDVLEKIPRL